MGPGDYTYNETFSYLDPPVGNTMDGNALFQCILSVIMAIVYIFITTAIVCDRKRYQKTFLLALLNFAVSYTLVCIMRYFGEVHINIFPETNKGICHTVHFLNSVISEGGEMAIFPIFIDLIVQHMMSERYEKRKYRKFMLILILVIWIVIIIKEIIYRSQSIMEYYCYESKPSGVMWTEFVFIILRVIVTLVAIGFLLCIAITKRPVSQILGSVVAPILTGIILSIVNLMTAIYQGSAMVGSDDLQIVAIVSLYIRLCTPIILALIWLMHNDFRGSIYRLLICSPCRKTGPQATEHELTTDIA